MKCFCHKPTSLIRHVSRNKWFLPWVPCPMPPLQLNLQIRYPVFFFLQLSLNYSRQLPLPPPLPHPRPHLHLLPQYFGSFGNEFLWRDFYVSIIPGTGAWLQGGAAKWGEWWILDQKSESDGAEPFKARHGCSLNKHIHDEIMLAHPNRCCT